MKEDEMKKLFLVKGEERHEVEEQSPKGFVRFKGTRTAVSIEAMEILGYKLEEVEERKEFWVGSLVWKHAPDINLQFLEARPKKPDITTALGEPWVHAVEIHPNERVLSREDVVKAWNENVTESGAFYPDFMEQLGFEGGE